MAEKYGFWTVFELKKELRRRNAKVTGKKEDLIERLAAYDRNNNFEYNIPEGSVAESAKSLSNVLWPPNEEFNTYQQSSPVPPIDIVHINNYFLSVYKLAEGMSMFAAVHRKGYSMMKNLFLLALVEAKNGEYHFYRAQVINSEMTKALTYYVKLVISTDGSISEASCECIAGKGFRAVCKHVAVVCYAILHLKEQGKLCIKDTCTDRKQIWHMPKKSRLDISPKKAEQINFTVPLYNMQKKQRGNLCYDPRPQKYRNMTKIQKYDFNDNVRNHVVNYTAGKKRTLCINVAFTAASVPDIAHDHDYLSPSIMHQMIYNRIQVTTKDIICIEEATRAQSNCAIWFQERSMRLTASNVGTVVHMTHRKNIQSFVDSFIEPRSFHSAATDWGKQNEKKAISVYEEATSNRVVSCGLFISLDHPYLAASPDGLVQSLTVLEVKCPYSIKDSIISSDSLPYLEMKNGELSLKTNSNYYYQVQTQMYVTSRDFCDFVIWTTKDYKCISVNKNYNVINNEILPKASEFFDKYMVPALANKYYSRC